MNPFFGVMRSVTLALPPGLVETALGVASTVKSGAEIATLIAGDVDAANVLSPL